MVSIVVPTLNAGPGLNELLTAIGRQVGVGFEVIVVDSGSQDDTVATAQGYGCKLIHETRFDHAKTRNLGVSHASGNVFVFVTQDVVPTSDHWLAELVRPIQEGTVAAAYGRQVAEADGPVIERSSRSFNYPVDDRTITLQELKRHGFDTLFFSNANSAVAKDWFERLGGFAYPRIFGEDVDFAFRLLEQEGAIRYASAASVWHTHRYTPVQVLRRYFDIGVVHSLHREWFKYGGSATGSGMRLARSTWNLIRAEGKYREALPTFLDLAARYLGYRLGGWHRRLYPRTVRALSMNRKYWEDAVQTDAPK